MHPQGTPVRLAARVDLEDRVVGPPDRHDPRSRREPETSHRLSRHRLECNRDSPCFARAAGRGVHPSASELPGRSISTDPRRGGHPGRAPTEASRRWCRRPRTPPSRPPVPEASSSPVRAAPARSHAGGGPPPPRSTPAWAGAFGSIPARARPAHRSMLAPRSSTAADRTPRTRRSPHGTPARPTPIHRCRERPAAAGRRAVEDRLPGSRTRCGTRTRPPAVPHRSLPTPPRPGSDSRSPGGAARTPLRRGARILAHRRRPRSCAARRPDRDRAPSRAGRTPREPRRGRTRTPAGPDAATPPPGPPNPPTTAPPTGARRPPAPHPHDPPCHHRRRTAAPRPTGLPRPPQSPRRQPELVHTRRNPVEDPGVSRMLVTEWS
jgi:hypothetical protein